ncbi:type II secretion system F family protein [uncultured Jatrophihabitans sp.]|uniref:type II secretion system F family protein n=1 Tax=uncultured Jatrophihabitans sp. TaxID=1610747 RepID=UPI0035CC10B4
MTALKTFSYEAMDHAGVIVKGKIESESSDAAAKALSGQRLVPLEITGQGTGLNKELSIPGFGGKTKLKDLAVFARQFASMTSSGLTLLRSLGILEEQTEKPKLKEAIAKVHADVQGGTTLSTAMSAHPDHFPLLMVNMVRAGETGGFLDDALARIALMYESDANLRAKIKSAMTYPVIVLLFSLLLGTGVIIFIVPVFEKMFKQLGGNLPLPTQIMVTLSHNMLWIMPIFLGLTIGGFKAYKWAVQNKPEFRLKMDKLKLRLPVFGPLFTKLAISRWARNLGTLLAVGVPIIQALEVVGGTSGNAVISAAMDDVRDTVRVGGQMSTTLEKHPLFPSMVTQMMQVGEETGQITDMLDKLADYYDKEVETATESLTSAMEPLLVVLLGAVIGVMVICLYLPMFSIYKHIQS